jgi:hypothetical protein
MTERRGWLTIWGGRKPLPAITARSAGVPSLLPPPVTARAARQLARQAAGIERPRLVVAVDATASRETTWNAFSKPLQDNLLTAMPGELDVALAVHGGSRVHTFSRFTSNPRELRDLAAGVSCVAGTTRLLDILRRVVQLKRVAVVLYVGDAFEESRADARRLADELLLQGTRVIILHDTSGGDTEPVPPAFNDLAERTAGAVLPFDISALDRLSELVLGDLLQAVAVLAVGDTDLLKTKHATMPAATLLLEHLTDRNLIGARRTKQ